MASFQAKIGWKWPRKRPKYKLSFRFVYTMHNRKFQTNSKKIQKIIKYYCGLISSQNSVGNAEKGRK